MTRWLQIIGVIAAAGAAIFVFQVKYRAEAVAEQAAKLQRELDQENETLSLLHAEWSLLIQPARVQELVERHSELLKLQPLDPVQITRLENLPMRPKGPAPEDESALSAILEGLPEDALLLQEEATAPSRSAPPQQNETPVEPEEAVDMGEAQ
jgi:hypothetical protein